MQLTTDGWKAYLEAVEFNFGTEIDYAQLHKIYGKDSADDEKRYSPAKCLGTEKKIIQGHQTRRTSRQATSSGKT